AKIDEVYLPRVQSRDTPSRAAQESTRFRLQLFEERHRPPSDVTPVAPKFCADPGPIEGTEQSVHPVRRARQRAAAPRPRGDALGQREASLLPRQSWVRRCARSARSDKSGHSAFLSRQIPTPYGPREMSRAPRRFPPLSKNQSRETFDRPSGFLSLS